MGNCYWDLLCDPGGRGGRGGWGCGAEHRQWRMQRGGASVAVEKIEQASSAKIFSGTARRQGLRFAEEWAAEEILDQVGSRLAAGRGLLDIKICMPTRQGIVCGRLKASRSHWEVTVCTPRRRGLPFAGAKGSKRVFKPNLRSPVGVAENMQGAKPVRLAAGAFLLCVQKEPKYAWGCAPRPRRVGTPRPESQSNGFPERD